MNPEKSPGKIRMDYPDMDRIYREMPLESIPWDSETPPGVLIDLVETRKILPCRAVDLGCGTGNYAMYLASKGFDVTGIDSSPTAIRIATEKAKKRTLSCRFIVADLLGDGREISGTFDFAFDWEFLHHIFPEDREKYLGNVWRMLNPGARYLSVSFSEDDPQFGGIGTYRKTRIGTTLYFSSEKELGDLFSRYFTLRELKTIDISGRSGPHRAVSVLSERE